MPESAEETKKTPEARTPRLWIFQGITIVVLLGAAWQLSHRLTAIEGRLDQQAKDIKSLSEQTKAVSDAVLNPRDGIAVRIAKIEEWTKYISPKISKTEFGQEINRLNARINNLQNQLKDVKNALRTTKSDLSRERATSQQLRNRLDALQKDLHQTNQDLEASRAEIVRQSREIEMSQGLRNRVRELDSELADVAGGLVLIEEEAKSPKVQLPEGYRSSLIERLMKLHQRLENIRKWIEQRNS